MKLFLYKLVILSFIYHSLSLFDHLSNKEMPVAEHNRNPTNYSKNITVIDFPSMKRFAAESEDTKKQKFSVPVTNAFQKHKKVHNAKKSQKPPKTQKAEKNIEISMFYENITNGVTDFEKTHMDKRAREK